MKKYRVTVPTLRLREKASSHHTVKILKTFTKNNEFYSDAEEVNPQKEKWARVVNELGQPIGFTQISNLKDENCKEIALPATPPIPPAMPEPPSGLDKLDEVLAIVQRIEARLSKL